MSNDQNFVIFVERKLTPRTYRRDLIECSKGAVRVFVDAIAAANYVEHMDNHDCFDSKDRVFVLHKSNLPELGHHRSPWVH